MEQSVTVIRKRDDSYIYEQISTAVILPGCGISEEQNRLNTIDRLRKDPSVIFVLDTDDLEYEGTAALKDNFRMTLKFDWDEPASASIKVMHKDELVFSKEYNLNDEEIVDETEPFESFLDEAVWILSCIDRRACFFLDSEHPLYPKERADKIFKILETSDFHWLLAESGFQTERIQVVGDAVNPLLLVHENMVAMVSSRHFSGKYLYVELKQFFESCKLVDVEQAVEKVKDRMRKAPLEIAHLQDGTWAFRMPLDSDVTKTACQEHLISRIEEMHTAIDAIKTELQYFPSEDYEMEKARQFFIYEVIDASIRLFKLP